MRSQLLSLLLTLLVCNLPSTKIIAQTTTTGPVIKFEYDPVGNRTKREYKPSETIYLKQGETPQAEDTSIQKFENDRLIIKAYPNPADDYITVENLSWKENDRVIARLFDITGKLITTKEFSAAKDNIQFSGITPGTYQLHYYLNRQLLTTWKIIKK